MKVNREEIYKKYHGHCAYCGKEIKFKEMQVDHFYPKGLNKPISKDSNGNYVYADLDVYENLMPSCRRCNHYKRANSINVFRSMIATIHERIFKIYIVKVAIDYGILKFNKWDNLFYFERINRL